MTLGPGWSHADVFERHEMARGDYWEFEASKGWSRRQGVSKPFSGGAGSGVVGGKVEPDRDLKPGGLPYQRPDLFINLFPRWNQHYKDGWYFAATDGSSYVGAVVVRAGQWVWPHDNSIQCLVKDSGDYAGLRGSTWHGQRLWWLFAPTRAPADIAYVTRYAWEGLDKLNHEFILDWPGQTKGSFSGMNFYDGGQMNPTGGVRGAGRRAIADAGKSGDLSTLTRVQVMLHPDAYGSLYDHWSPENPNFFTDFTKVPIALTAQLRTHPRFEELRKAAEAKLREDMDHSITLPGGAGQECPGYVGYALKNWAEIAPVCRQYLGFDPTTWERYKAAEHFQKRITYPDGDARRQLPMGDTHPTKDDGPAKVDVPADEVAAFARGGTARLRRRLQPQPRHAEKKPTSPSRPARTAATTTATSSRSTSASTPARRGGPPLLLPPPRRPGAHAQPRRLRHRRHAVCEHGRLRAAHRLQDLAGRRRGGRAGGIRPAAGGDEAAAGDLGPALPAAPLRRSAGLPPHGRVHEGGAAAGARVARLLRDPRPVPVPRAGAGDVLPARPVGHDQAGRGRRSSGAT